MPILNELTDDFDRATALVNILIDRATGSSPSEGDFAELHLYFVNHTDWSQLVPTRPALVRCTEIAAQRSLNQFWQHIKNKYSTYAERRTYLWEQFDSLLTRLETGTVSPAEDDIETGLKAFSSDEVNRSWRRMVQRIGNDPEGAITASRNLLETVLKHILDTRNIEYDQDRIELPDLYKAVQKELGLAPEQHQEQIFKQILGGCSGVVNGLGAMRNRLGDAHGVGTRGVRPAPRHARLAVNLAGSMALFLTETHTAKTT
jgi:hypothetical protein